MRHHLFKALAVVFIFTILCNAAHSENTILDLAQLSIDELLNLRAEIDSCLESKGYKVYFDIERGAKGESVSNIQERLTELGYYSGKITGKFDSETQKSFKFFEKANGLPNDGNASREDQIVLFGDTVLPKATMSPTASPAVTSVAKSEHDTSFDYEQCLRFPDDCIGKIYSLKGKVEQTMGSRQDGFQIRFSVLGNSEEIIYVYVNSDPGYNILQNDWLVIDLTMCGTITYESVWGHEITIPAAVASVVVLK